MGNVILSQTDDQPITLAEAKKHCRVEHTRDDDLIRTQIKAARRWLETERAMQLINTTRSMTLRHFPGSGGIIRLPHPPVRSVTHLKYISIGGTLTTLTEDEHYLVSLEGPIPFIEPAYLFLWPQVREQHNAVQIEYVCGPATSAGVDEAGKCAMLLIVGTMYKHREHIVTGTIVAEVTRALDALIGAEGVSHLL